MLRLALFGCVPVGSYCVREGGAWRGGQQPPPRARCSVSTAAQPFALLLLVCGLPPTPHLKAFLCDRVREYVQVVLPSADGHKDAAHRCWCACVSRPRRCRCGAACPAQHIAVPCVHHLQECGVAHHGGDCKTGQESHVRPGKRELIQIITRLAFHARVSSNETAVRCTCAPSHAAHDLSSRYRVYRLSLLFIRS
jgi:hypothetical protein